MRQYAVFHDESKEDGYWHIFFWVPLDFLDELAECLQKSRKNSGYGGMRLSFKKLRGSPTAYRCANYWLTVMKASLHNHKPHQLVDFDLGRTFDCMTKKWRPIYRKFSKMPCCKVNIFHLPNGHQDLDLCKDETARIETTFRMGLKGGAHYLFAEENPCRVSNIWLDREKHYQRPLEKKELLTRLRAETRDYVVLPENCWVEGEDVPGKEQLVLDAVDILLGSFRHAHVHGASRDSDTKERKHSLIRITHDLLVRLHAGPARMKNSRFYKGYSLSQARIVDGRWDFALLHPEIIKSVYPPLDQMRLFD